MDVPTQNQFLILAAVSAVGFAVLGWMTLRIRGRMKKMWGGLSPSGDAVQDMLQRTMHLEARLEEIEPRMRVVEASARASIQKVGFLRFNPFQDTGGDNSFSVALLDQRNNGVVLSSLYMREGTRVYAKEVKNGATRQPLSDEETKVLETAVRQDSRTS